MYHFFVDLVGIRPALVLALVSGCYDPTIQECQIRCEQQKCPSGLECDTGFCVRPGAISGEQCLQQVIALDGGADARVFIPDDAGRPPDDMVSISGGSFMLGCSPSDGNCDDDEGPRHEVVLSGFYIDRNEVTQIEYSLCVEAGACTVPAVAGGIGRDGFGSYDPSNADKQLHPVSGLTRDQAAAYCQWLDKALPTEAQWERAARGTSDGNIYPWGPATNVPGCGYTNARYNCFIGTKVSGGPINVDLIQGGDSSEGARNMAGNVWEWVSDDYSATYYQDSNGAMDPTGPAPGSSTQGILRGGGFASAQLVYLRVSNRNAVNFTSLSSIEAAGVRCARSIP